MVKNGLSKLFYGFIFIMLSINIQGFDILPDIVGYIFFAFGFKELFSSSKYFSKAYNYNFFMIIISLFSIYQSLNQNLNTGINILSILLMVVSITFNALTVYNLFLGIKEMAETRSMYDLADESNSKWNLYLLIPVIFVVTFLMSIFTPSIAVLFVFIAFVVDIIITIHILKFIGKCRDTIDNEIIN